MESAFCGTVFGTGSLEGGERPGRPMKAPGDPVKRRGK